MTAGRPTPDRISVGEAFIKYAEENPTCVTVPHFAKTIGMSSDTMITWCEIDIEFRQLYRKAKELIGINRLKCTQPNSQLTISDSTYRGTLHHYDYDIKHDIRDEKKFESSLRKDEEGTKQSTYYITVPHDLAAGLNLSASSISNSPDKGSK
jgi:hypothetical protein